MGAPLGNQNGRKENRLWRETLLRAAKQKNAKGVEKLRAVADALVDSACDGDVRAAIEIGDRLDGKSAQMIVGPGDDGEHKLDVRWDDGKS